jgi:predicted nucleic acid-binding protein
MARRHGDPAAALRLLHALIALLEVIHADIYGEFENDARSRLSTRDPEDWPILASAIALECPIWTEDADFFGCGVATWTSNLVEIFLRR